MMANRRQSTGVSTAEAGRAGVTSYRLDLIASVKQGYTFSPDRQGQTQGKWLYVKVGDLNSHGNSKYMWRTTNYISDDVLAEMRAEPFLAGSIVFPRVGAALRNNNKRILQQDCLTDDNVIVVTVRDPNICCAEYLYYWFDYHDLQQFCNDGTVPVINGQNLRKQKVALPGIEAQKRMASMLSAWDTAIEKTEQLISAKERHYTHELSRLISQGQHPRSHVGSFAHEVSERNRSSAWRRVTLANIATVWKGQQLNKDAMIEDGTYYVLNGGIGPSGRTTSWNCEANTITVSEGGNSCGFVNFNRENFWCGGHCYALRNLHADIDVHYLFHYMKGRQNQLMMLRVGSGLPNIQKAGIESFSVVLPDLSRQAAIARYLNALREEITTLGAYVEKLKGQKRGLMQKLLTGQWRVKLSDEANK